MSVFITLLACTGAPPAEPDAPEVPAERRLVLAAYTTPREVLADQIIPAFQARWETQTGQKVTFETSFQGSGSQSRAVEGGLEADVVWLSLTPDLDRLVEAKLVPETWDDGPTQGIVSSSVAVIGVRPGNPRQLFDWADLARPGVEVLTPNVRTSGGAMWNVLGVVGAPVRAGDAASAEGLLAGVLGNVRVMDKGARDAMLSFEKGVGDAVITYENEAVVAKSAGQAMDYVIPPSTVVIENPAAVVAEYADRHGVRDVADAFVAFLLEPDQQAAMTKYGLRPVVDGVAAEGFPALVETFRVADLGGWGKVQAEVFADGALYDRAYARSRDGK